jgi:recombination protein RecT
MTNAELVKTEPKPAHPMVQLRNYLDTRIGEIKTALPGNISPQLFARVIITAAQLNREILARDRASLWNAAMRAANDGLLPDGVEGAIVPFKGKATWIPMYQGLLKKFRNSGEFKWVSAGIVYDGEEYDHWIDETGEHFRHRPGDDNTNKKIRRVYALATTKDGGSFIADLSLGEVNKRRAMSRASREDAPWKMWEHEMMKKTAIRVLSKLLPKSSDVDALMQRDEEALYGVEAVEERRQTMARPTDTAAALDAFGASSAASGEPALGSEGGAQESKLAEAADMQASAARTSQSEKTPDASAPAAADDSIIRAYELGKKAKDGGNRRNSLPGQYRDASHDAEAEAWLAGWDGKPNPVTGELL